MFGRECPRKSDSCGVIQLYDNTIQLKIKMRKDKLNIQELKTIEYYDQNAEDWSERHSGGEMFDPEMELMFGLLTAGKILEIGTGSGEDADKLITHYGSENYVGVDASKGLLKIAQKRNPKANFINLSIYDLGKLDHKFDGFWVSAMLIHVPKNKLQAAFENLKNVLNDRAIGFISIMEGTADMEESRPGRHYTLWMPNEFEKELKDAKFEIIKSRRIETKASPWLTYILRKT